MLVSNVLKDLEKQLTESKCQKIWIGDNIARLEDDFKVIETTISDIERDIKRMEALKDSHEQ